MIKVSELLSKQLICLDTATIAGTISNILFDEHLTKGKLLEILSEDDDTPEIKYVEIRRVSSLSEDAGVVKTADCIRPEWNSPAGSPNPINCLGFNQDGKALGRVRDILLDGTAVVKIILEQAEFTPKELLSYSDSLLIFNDTGKPYKIPKPRAKVPEPKQTDRTVLVHSFGAESNTAAVISNESDLSPTAMPVDIPTKIPQSSTQVSRSPAEGETGYKFLLGKTVHSDITASDGRVLIPNCTVVTDEVIRVAREGGRLVQLALRAY